MIRNVKTRKIRNAHQNKLNTIIKNIRNAEEIIVNSDKTGNKYMVNKDEYKRIIINEITKDHRKLNETCDKVEKINSKASTLVTELGLSERVDRMEIKDAFASLKDHKTDFRNNPKMRLINPSKQNLGKASKIIIANMVLKIKHATKLNLSRSTDESLKWFKNIN